MVLGCFHLFALTWSFVVLSAKVKDAVDDDTVQFFLIFLSEELGIGAYGVERNHNIAVEHIVFTIVEGDDIGIIVVLQELPVHFKNMFVVTEQITHFAYLLSIGGGNAANPSCGVALLDFGHGYVFTGITNHGREGIEGR